MIYGPCIDLWPWGHVLWKVVLYDTPDQTSRFQFFIAKLYGEEAHITYFLEEVGHSIIKKMLRFKLIDAEFWIEISNRDFEISHVN